MSDRRWLSYTVLGCLAGAGLALFAVTRTWLVVQTARSGPTPLVEYRTGADLVPWLRALALVGLAGAGALLATRGVARAVVGGLVAACGLGLMAGAGYGVSRDASPWWPAMLALGGATLVALGGLAAVRGRRWPALGARYERPAGGRVEGQPAPSTPGASTTQAWDALDRGEDPTAG